MTLNELYENILKKRSFLCVGLDSDSNKIPAHLLKEKDPVFEFNKQIIDATHDLAIAYKPNVAFYESRGVEGWQTLIRTVEYLNKNYPDQFLIADAKRGDIGNTSEMYAKAFFDKKSSGLEFDAITVAPYMGRDSVVPFLSYKNKWVILLSLTSNEGSEDFQFFFDNAYRRLYEQVIKTSQYWGEISNMMYVVGATQHKKLREIRRLVPNHFLLIPGVGAQGGHLRKVAQYGLNDKCGLIVNSARAIIFADSSKKFAKVARQKAKEMQQEMSEHIKTFMKK